jgi:hypothetical protein
MPERLTEQSRTALPELSSCRHYYSSYLLDAEAPRRRGHKLLQARRIERRLRP